MVLAWSTAATVAAAVALASLAVYVWRRRGAAAGLSLAVVLVAVAWWATAYAAELSSDDLGVRGLWGDLKYLGICALPAAWLVFVLQYTGRVAAVGRRLLVVLAIEPVVLLVLLFLPATHDLVRYYDESVAGDAIPLVSSGPVFWVHLAYSNAVLLTATWLFVARMLKLSRTYRMSAVGYVAAAFLPWIANLLYNFEVGPFARVDLTPFAFVVTGAVLVWGLFRDGLVNLASVAWETVVETMEDAVILLDAFGRITDANPATVSMLRRPRAALVGRRLADVVPGYPDPAAGRAAPGADLEVTLDLPTGQRHVELRRQPLPGRGEGQLGELVVLRDITSRKHSEFLLRDLLAERSRVASTLEASLLPSRLPRLPHCELAAVYQPAPGSEQVGGDFYDVFPLAPDAWGMVLGDVSGKGAQAAVTTALVRYSLRSLAEADSPPSKVLARLNAVMLRDCLDEEFATLVYAVARVDQEGVALTLALAGHHQPLLRRAGGQVEPVGELGTALGLVPYPHLSDVSVRLGPGDLVCLFTDGLVEARGSGGLFGEQRASAALAAVPFPVGSPERVVDDLVGAARRFHRGPLTDDVAVLALGVQPPDVPGPLHPRHAGDVLPTG